MKNSLISRLFDCEKGCKVIKTQSILAKLNVNRNKKKSKEEIYSQHINLSNIIK